MIIPRGRHIGEYEDVQTIEKDVGETQLVSYVPRMDRFYPKCASLKPPKACHDQDRIITAQIKISNSQ